MCPSFELSFVVGSLYPFMDENEDKNKDKDKDKMM